MATGKQLIFRPDAAEPEVTERTTRPTLEEAQRLVGGYIELIGRFHSPKGYVMALADEDGRRKGLAPNVAATAWLLAHGVNASGGIVGDLLVLLGKDVHLD